MASTLNIVNTIPSNTYLTSAGTGLTYSTSWQAPNSTFTNSNGTAVMYMPSGEDKVIVSEKAALEVKGKMIINGVDLEERLSTIEKVLNIPTRDVTLEAKYPKLAKLYHEYTQELEKYKTFERLKGESDDKQKI